MNKLIIFNADDFNLTPGVNKGIIDSHLTGVVRSASIMVNLPGFEKSVELLKQTPCLDVGIHINLTYGHPLTDISEVPSLVDDNGNFWRKPSILIENANFDDMIKEITAQVELCLNAGLSISHLDSHHHLHATDLRVAEFIIKTAKIHKLAIRSTNPPLREMISSEGIPTPDGFIDSFYGAGHVNVEHLESIIEKIPGGITEIMCHPGIADDELMLNSSYNKLREMEIETLTHPRTIQALEKNKAKIIGFRDILDFSPGFEKPHKHH